MTSPQPLREPRRCARRPRCVSRPRDAAPAVKPRAALGRCYADASSFVVPTSALATSARRDVVGSIPSCAAPLPKDPTAVAVVLLLDFLFFDLTCRISANQNHASLKDFLVSIFLRLRPSHLRSRNGHSIFVSLLAGSLALVPSSLADRGRGRAGVEADAESWRRIRSAAG